MALALIAAVMFGAAQANSSISFTVDQAIEGEAAYEVSCARCHDPALRGSQLGPALLSADFATRWGGRPISKLFSKIKETMPPGSQGSLTDDACADIISFILESYGIQAGPLAMPSQMDELAKAQMPARDVLQIKARRADASLLAPDVTLPKWEPAPNPLGSIRHVTQEMLELPPDESWLNWRRTLDAAGYSPLKEINQTNVHRLRLVWALALPPGPNRSTPLVHDGVMFIQSFGENIQAIDATNGEVLWTHHHEIPEPSLNLPSRNIAIFSDKVYFTTSDARVVALNAKTGSMIWEQQVGDASKKTTMATSGPLIAQRVLMQGVLGAGSKGGGQIVGLDAETGQRLWSFNTVAQPGEPNGNSWNGLPWDKRSGGSIWTAGSYSKEDGVALFGPAPTYDTGPLRQKTSIPGVNNDALYTNTTIALDPGTGKLKWYFQHLPNDQWDLDWAFERQVVSLPARGAIRRHVITAGKMAIYDAIDIVSGKYAFSIDLGLQNLVVDIDRKSGKKHIDRRLIPEGNGRVTICPHLAGAKSWLPGSYDHAKGILFVPLVESCMDIVPARRRTVFEGKDIQLRPRPSSDGRFGRLQAINFAEQKTVWAIRQRAPQTTGILATAGEVLFAGALDRVFTAYAADTGYPLFRVRLSDVPNSAPITYAVNGRQHIAVVVGSVGYGQAAAFYPLVPEFRQIQAPNSAVWVFALEWTGT